METSSPRAGLPGPLGIPPQPSRAPTPPPAPVDDISTVLPPKPSTAASAAAEIVGFTLPPVDRVAGSLNDAADTANRLSAQIRNVLSTSTATAEAIAGKLSSVVIGELQSALAAGQAACDGVYSCVVAQTLAAIGTVNQSLLSMGLPSETVDEIVNDLGAIFGPLGMAAPQGPVVGAPTGVGTPGSAGSVDVVIPAAVRSSSKVSST